MYSASNLPQSIDIGYTGEKYFRELEVDLSDWLEEMPAGVAAVVYQKPGGTATRPTVSAADGILTWEISDTDLGTTEGVGSLQLEMSETANGVTRIRKSHVIRVIVNLGLMR